MTSEPEHRSCDERAGQHSHKITSMEACMAKEMAQRDAALPYAVAAAHECTLMTHIA